MNTKTTLLAILTGTGLLVGAPAAQAQHGAHQGHPQQSAPPFFGELSVHGTWSQHAGHGWVWQPRLSIHLGSRWSPHDGHRGHCAGLGRCGHWSHVTWRYGRWVRSTCGRYMWVPHSRPRHGCVNLHRPVVSRPYGNRHRPTRHGGHARPQAQVARPPANGSGRGARSAPRPSVPSRRSMGVYRYMRK